MSERRKSAEPTGIFPIAVALAVIGAIVGSLWWQTRDGPMALYPAGEARTASTSPVQVVDEPPAPRLPEAINAFLHFAESPAPDVLPLDHGYTAEGVRRLADAIAVRGESGLWSDRARRLRAAASALEADPNSTQHADLARETFVQAAEVAHYFDVAAAVLTPQRQQDAQGGRT